MKVHELCVIQLKPSDRSSGYLRESDLTADTWSAVGWHSSTPIAERRVVVDLRFVVGYGAGTVEKIARVLVDAGTGIVQVEGTRKSGQRNAFAAQLRDAVQCYERSSRR